MRKFKSRFLLLLEATDQQANQIFFFGYVKLLMCAHPFFCVSFVSPLLGCRMLEDGNSALVDFPAELCHDSHWDTTIMPLALLGLIFFCFGLPIVLLAATLKWRKTDDELTRYVLWSLFCGHKWATSGYIWRVMHMFRCLLIVVVAYAPIEVTSQVVIICMTLATMIFAEGQLQPRCTTVLAFLESFEDLTLLFVIVLAHLYQVLGGGHEYSNVPVVMIWACLVTYLGSTIWMAVNQVSNGAISAISEVLRTHTASAIAPTSTRLVTIVPAPAN
jgi:hypothetical protein